MDNIPPKPTAAPAADEPPDHLAAHSSGRKRSGSGGSILSKFPFMRTSDSRASAQEAKLQQQGLSQQQAESPKDAVQGSRTSPRALAAAISQQQHSGRRRKGSLRKVALLGRGAARDRREREAEAATGVAAAAAVEGDSQAQAPAAQNAIPIDVPGRTSATTSPVHGLGITGIPSPSTVSSIAGSDVVPAAHGTSSCPTAHPQVPSPSRSPTSTTDDDDVLVMPSRDQSPAHLSSTSLASMSNAFFAKHSRTPSIQRRRSNRTATSPLSLQGLTTSPLPQSVEDHDYSETEWWGWVILIVTWFVFVIGMGSCLNIWSWAWDVGTTPYAPPELEDDPTLPIVGYYPALMILTTIMAWVWVIVAWVGMKYFRHAKMTGD
ncbi:uncharacterized protein B0I36DRAFT_321133 [Microdochium trichocladiopsis]|uniref:Uncharacterized protein n=1 Tax=Microdochium trichocladiopsis TaxID=1682393 RepID=A0A9P8YBH8_9PEZI|nr:uncharacterized protein B0I36DRAFT_321133 [Microdochium trichocladiopsis]KAH7033284.1 hypothetical protein B0I36DRAFT_321133 [Microdochium trichocladiopsis]